MTTKTPNPSLTRRGLLRKGTAATVATLGVGASASRLDRSPVGSAQAIGPLGAVAAAALTYLAYKGATKILGDTRDYSDYTGANALHTEILAGATKMQSADERVMTSIQNNITNSQNIALAKGKAAVIEKMNAGNSESAAQTAMQNAIDEYYTTIQKNIFNHFQTQHNQVLHHYERVSSHSNLSPSDVFAVYSENAGQDTFLDPMFVRPYGTGDGVVDHQFTYLNGDTATYKIPYYTSSTSFWFALTWDHAEQAMLDDGEPDVDMTGPNDQIQAIVKDPDSSDTVRYFRPPQFSNAWNALLTERDDVNTQLSGFVSDVYAQYSADEIPTEDLVDPITASTELSQDYDGYQTQAAHAAMLGIPTNAANSLILEVEDPSDGSTALLEADLYTEHVPTDGSGNEVGFQVDQTYDPSMWSEPLYIAYRYTETDDSGQVISETQEFEQLEMPFTVLEATDKDGNQVTSFQTESKNNQTSDVATIEEELDQIRQTQIEMQEEAQDDTQSGGGTDGTDSGFNWDQFSIAGIPGVAVVAIGGLAAYAGFQSGNYGN